MKSINSSFQCSALTYYSGCGNELFFVARIRLSNVKKETRAIFVVLFSIVSICYGSSTFNLKILKIIVLQFSGLSTMK